MPHPFDGVWAKVKRSREHRDCLDSLIRTTFEERDNLPRVGTKYDEGTGDHVVYVSHMPDLGDLIERASLLLGDSIHNLRSSLDHLAYALADKFTRGNIKNPHRIEFPITDSDELWQKRLWRLSEVDPDDVAVIKSYQPYEAVSRAGQPQGSRTRLGMLRDLDDWDKHRLLTPVMIPGAGLQNAHPQALAIWMPSAFAMINSTQRFPPVRLNTVIARARFPDNVRLSDMEMAGYLAARLEVRDFDADPVELIDAITERVAEIIGRFSPV
ncbi:MAG: hypothetical protein R3B59_09060 [Dehalococcoidia bacterium]